MKLLLVLFNFIIEDKQVVTKWFMDDQICWYLMFCFELNLDFLNLWMVKGLVTFTHTFTHWWQRYRSHVALLTLILKPTHTHFHTPTSHSGRFSVFAQTLWLEWGSLKWNRWPSDYETTRCYTWAQLETVKYSWLDNSHTHRKGVTLCLVLLVIHFWRWYFAAVKPERP